MKACLEKVDAVLTQGEKCVSTLKDLGSPMNEFDFGFNGLGVIGSGGDFGFTKRGKLSATGKSSTTQGVPMEVFNKLKDICKKFAVQVQKLQVLGDDSTNIELWGVVFYSRPELITYYELNVRKWNADNSVINLEA